MRVVPAASRVPGVVRRDAGWVEERRRCAQYPQKIRRRAPSFHPRTKIGFNERKMPCASKLIAVEPGMARWRRGAPVARSAVRLARETGRRVHVMLSRSADEWILKGPKRTCFGEVGKPTISRLRRPIVTRAWHPSTAGIRPGRGASKVSNLARPRPGRVDVLGSDHETHTPPQRRRSPPIRQARSA